MQNEKNDVTMAQIIRLLESKVLAHCSPLVAKSSLHSLHIRSMTFVQLQACCTKLVFMATRMENPSTRDAMRRLRDTNAFLMAISTSERVAMHNENQRRAILKLAPLLFDQMVDMLQNLASDKTSYMRDPV